MAQAKTKARKDAPAGSAQAVRVQVPERTDILVKAIGRGDGIAGYYNLTRFRDGDTFFLNKEEDFSERWMVAVDANREEIPEETKRLAKIANAARRKAAAEQAKERATFTTERDPDAEFEAAEKDLEAAKSEAPKRPARGKAAPAVDVGFNQDPKRKIAGTDYERHEDVQPTDNQGVEPQGGRASDKHVA
jgi:hypothetical protein